MATTGPQLLFNAGNSEEEKQSHVTHARGVAGIFTAYETAFAAGHRDNYANS
jgi:hypothetical protein